MGFCTDKSVNYLQSMGLNTIRHPEENIHPLMLLGEYKGSRAIIGTLDQLIDDATKPLPPITASVASKINGETTSKLPVSIGLDILGALVGVAGATIGVKASYEKARTMRFTFDNVTLHRANIVQLGDFVQSGEVRWNHIILKKYLLGAGKLYVITEVARSDSVKVEAFGKDKAALEVNVPVIPDALGGELKIGHEGESKTTVTYKGAVQMAFGFKAIELAGAVPDDGEEMELVFRPVEDGTISKSFGAQESATLAAEGALDSLGHADPAALGEA